MSHTALASELMTMFWAESEEKINTIFRKSGITIV